MHAEPGTYELLRTDCYGKGTFMPGSPYEMEAESPAIARALELLHQVSRCTLQ